MTKKKRFYWTILGIFLFLAYIFLAARPVSHEITIKARWIGSLETGISGPGISGAPQRPSGPARYLLPFRLGRRFGYMDNEGRFPVNKTQEAYVSMSQDAWTEYQRLPDSLDIRNPLNDTTILVSAPEGYPVFLDGRLYLVGGDQSSLLALDGEGQVTWTHFFSAPLTGLDAAAGLILAGALDGSIELIDQSGALVYTFEPGGSRIPCIYGCAISSDGSKLALISGLDEQRFLFLEKSGETYRVAYHEALGEGFRRPVQTAFIDNDRRVSFERREGLGIFNTESLESITIALDGRIYALDGRGDGGFLFLITGEGEIKKNLVAIRYPDQVFIQAPFKSEAAFLGRHENELYIGGGGSLIAFDLGYK
jgi:hypothetical protein